MPFLFHYFHTLPIYFRVVYKTKGKECDGEYTGETGRQLRIRIRQHQEDLSLITERSALAEHSIVTGHEIDW